RFVFARRAVVFLHHRRAAVRRVRDLARHAAVAVARSASAAPLKAGLSALASGDRAAVPGNRTGLASPDGVATGVRTGASRTGQTHRAVGAVAARSALDRVAPPLQSRADPTAIEIRCGGTTGFGADRGRRDRYRGRLGRAQRVPARNRRAVAVDAAVGA